MNFTIQRNPSDHLSEEFSQNVITKAQYVSKHRGNYKFIITSMLKVNLVEECQMNFGLVDEFLRGDCFLSS